MLIVLGVVLVNLVAFLLVGNDKARSTRQGSERVPEVYLFFIAIFFASFGVLAGIFFFIHKTRKIYFPLGIGLLLIQQILLLYLLFKLTS